MTQALKTRTRARSAQWFARAQQSLVEGVNSPARGAAVYKSDPIVLERGRGSRVWDADDNQYIDFMMSFGALIQGHAHPKLVEAVSQAMAEGSHFAAVTSAEVEAAERFRRMVPSAEAVRFTNTGSEATMLALRLPRCAGRMAGVLQHSSRRQHFRQGARRRSADRSSGRATCHPGSHALERQHGSALRHLQWSQAHHEGSCRQS